jgi:Glycosyltransferase family 87
VPDDATRAPVDPGRTPVKRVRLALFAVAWALGLLGFALALSGSHGGDRLMYWSTVGQPLYVHAEFTKADFLYSPIAAQLLYPLSRLPWSLFWALFALAGSATFLWLLAPLGWAFGLPLFLAVLPIALNGNIEWLMALVVVFGSRYPGLWAIPLLTKVSPGVGLLWFAVRREWRALAIAAAVTVAVVCVSFLFAPALWFGWVGMLWENAQARGEGWSLLPIPLIWRTFLAAIVIAWGAHANRRWALLAGVMLARPDLLLAELSMLAVIPRLTQRERPEGASA